MSPQYLLDTNIVSDLVRNPQGPSAARLAAVGERAVATSVIVAAEMRYGAAKRGSARLSQQVEAVLDAMEILPVEPPADVYYAAVRVALEAGGAPIGGNDMLIAAQALALNRVLVTNNTREFARIAGLELEDWLSAPR